MSVSGTVKVHWCDSQFTVTAFAIAQFAVAYSLIAQFRLHLAEGHGQLVFDAGRLLGLL